MKSDKNNRPPVSLDDLFALKRAERPDDDFWNDFQREFHERQRAEAIEPKRWWFMLPRVFSQLSRYQMPIGATAVLAVTFLSFRDYREPGFEVAYTSPAPVAVQPAVSEVIPQEVEIPETVVAEVQELTVEQAALASSELPETTTVVTPVSATFVELAPMVVWAGPAINAEDIIPAEPSPSERSIAANLLTVEAEQIQVGRLLGEPQVDLAAAVDQSETLSQVTVPQPTRERLFVYQAPTDDFVMEGDQPATRDTHGNIARQINQDELYESVSRLTADADRLTLKF